jgi:hypothetical protein
VKCRPSVDELGRLVEIQKRLLSFELSPHGDRPPQEPALLLDAIVFDDSLDACEPIACAAMINWPHAISVLPIATANLYPIAQCESVVSKPDLC